MIAKLLIDGGAHINAQNEEGKTLLMIAAENGDYKLIKLLLEKGADITCQSKKGFTASRLADQNGHFDIVKLIRKFRVK